MEIKQYKIIVDKTAIFPQEVKNFGKAYCMLGLVGEYQEFWQAESYEDKIKEMGDIFWYVTALCREFGIRPENTFPEMFDKDETVNISTELADLDSQKCIGHLSELIKKYYRDKTEPNIAQIEKLIYDLVYSLYAITLNENLSISLILSTNYAKLSKRKQTNTLQGSGDNREEEV